MNFLDDELSRRIMEEIKALVRADAPLMVPPNVFRELAGRFADYVKNESMTMVFPVPEKYAGPSGALQGGIITAAFDAAFGCLAFLATGAPGATVTIETTYVRPVDTGDEELTVNVFLAARTRSLAFLDGKAYNKAQQLVATAKTTYAILAPRPDSGE